MATVPISQQAIGGNQLSNNQNPFFGPKGAESLKQIDDEGHLFLLRLFAESPVGLNLCRLSDGMWLASNQAFLDIIGYSAEEADGGLTYWQLTPDKYAEDEAEQLKSLDSTGAYGPYEKEFIHKEGHLVNVRLNGFITECKSEKYIWSFIENITERVNIEREKKETQGQIALSAKLASIGTMAAGVAHEINNPLAILYMLLEKSKHEIEMGKLDPLKLIDQLSSGLDRIKGIVDGLRIYSRTDVNQQRREVFHAHEVIQNSVQLISTLYKSTGIEIECQLKGARDTLMGNPGQFQQVLMNLLENAKDALAEKPEGQRKIVVSTVTDMGTGGQWVQVRDTGCGIPGDVQKKMFDLFYTTKPVGKGTGLGLGISHSFVQEMGGEIKVESQVGEGTTFTMRLPVYRQDESSENKPAKDETSGSLFCPEGQGQRVLVAEDEVELAELFKMQLEEWGFQVECVHNGRQALDRLLQDPESIDILVTDLNMPTMAGDDLIKEVIAQLGERQPKIVLMSGGVREDWEKRISGVKAHVVQVLNKPLGAKDLSVAFTKLAS